MKFKISKQDNELTISFPLKTQRCNPYDPDYKAEMDTFIGLIDKWRWGLAYRIDMEYADKGDQWTDIVIDCSSMSEEEFVKKCNELKIDIVYEVAKNN